MNPPKAAEQWAEHCAAYLAACDEALAEGRDPPPPTIGATPDQNASLEQLQACLRRLDRYCRGTAGAEDQEAGTAQGVPQHVGRFEIVRELGRGAHGLVFLAADPRLGRQVALKVPRAEALLSPDLRRRFLREARAAAGLSHANLVPILEAGEDGALCYLVSEYCPGPTLAVWLRQQPELVPPRLAAVLVAALANAMQHAHERGVLHRDLKPSNVLLASGGRQSPVDNASIGDLRPLLAEIVPRITDFGLAKLVAAEDDSTHTGAILGTPAYMSPEQAEGRPADIGPATDIYALGAILYEILTERPPFKAATMLATLEQVRKEPPLAPSKLHRGLPRDLETICLKCLAKDPASRYTRASELAADLRRFLAGEPIQATPPSWWTLTTTWCSQPERLRAAGRLNFTVGGIFLVWSGMVSALVVLGLVPTITDGPVTLTVQMSGLITLFPPMVIFGWLLQRTGKLLFLSLLSVTLVWYPVLCSLHVFFFGMELGGIFPTEVAFWSVGTINLASWAMLATADAIAWYAWYVNRTVPAKWLTAPGLHAPAQHR